MPKLNDIRELRNVKMCRWVKRGAKGIALIDDSGRKKRLRYVFDISDTRMVEGGRTPFLWQIKEEQREAIRKFLVESYWLEGEGIESLPGVLQVLFVEVTEELDEVFAGIEEFGSLSRLSFLGDATNKFLESVLVWIRREMQKIYQEEMKQKKNQEGEKEHETDLSPKRGLPVHRPDHNRGGRENREIRDAAGNIPEGTSEGMVSEPSSFREAESAPGGNRESSQGKDGSDRRRIIGEASSPGQEGRLDGMDGLHEYNSRNGGGSRSARSGVLLRKDADRGEESDKRQKSGKQEELDKPEEPDKQENSGRRREQNKQDKSDKQKETIENDLHKAGEEQTSVLLLPDLPGIEC